MVDAVLGFAIVLMVSKLPERPCDFVHQGRIEDALLIFVVERGGRQTDFAQGGADIPEHPDLIALRVRLLDTAELAEEREKAAMTEHFGKRAIIDPALVAGKMRAQPYRQH